MGPTTLPPRARGAYDGGMKATLLAAAALAAFGASARAQAARAAWSPADLMRPPQADSGLAAKPSPGPVADPARWLTILRRIRDLGVYKPAEGQDPAQFTLTRVDGSTSAAHASDLVGALGEVTPQDGLFHPLMVNFVSERWTPHGEGWTVDQWLLACSVRGQVKFAMHERLEQTRDMTVTSSQELDASQGEAAEFSTLVSRWASTAPPDAPKGATP